MSESSRFAAFLHSLVLQSAYNYQGFQHVGFCSSLLPALDDIYEDPAERTRVAGEHLEYFNANPFLSTFAIGAVMYLEERRAAAASGSATVSVASSGGVDAEGIARTKRTLGSLLGNVGDRLFWAGLLPLAALAGMFAYLLSPLYGVLVLLLAFNVPALAVRAEGLRAGYHMGPQAAPSLAVRAGLQGVRWIRRVGAFVAGMLIPVAAAHPQGGSSLEVTGLILGTGALTWILLSTPLRRVLALLLLAALISLYALVT